MLQGEATISANRVFDVRYGSTDIVTVIFSKASDGSNDKVGEFNNNHSKAVGEITFDNNGD
jgi:hypothetical protein